MRWLPNILVFIFLVSCQKKETLFRLIDSSHSGITFNNKLIPKDTANILDNEYFYNGGGVAVGDLNNDGLLDIYFTGNQVKNSLYLNLGQLRFKEVSDLTGAQKKDNQWSSGVCIIDINTDGLNDIFVCNSLSPDSTKLKNNVFINQGIDKNGVPKFKDLADKYGLGKPSNTNSCQFFDYDLDGDLDLYLTVNLLDVQYPNQYYSKNLDGSTPTRDLLFRQDFSADLGHPVFIDVSLESSIVWPGYSHSTLIHDFNHDSLPDIYVSNDYLSNDLVYINSKENKFTNRASEVFKHTAFSSMGSDLGDINNDGLFDILSTEMLPYLNKRKKAFIAGNTYTTYIFNERYKYDYQYFRNTLQLNQGLNPETGIELFSDISMMAGVHETDWSWSALFSDFDNDGFEDIFISNGFRKDISDHDFVDYRKNFGSTITVQELYDQIPEIKIPNFVFKNNGNLRFTDKSNDWGLNIDSFSNGAAIADLDNDGDIDLLVNNIDQEAFLFENSLYDQNDHNNKETPNFIKIKPEGPNNNKAGIGSIIKVYANGRVHTRKIISNRGYLSQSDLSPIIGIGEASKIDSVLFLWDDARSTIVRNPAVNHVLKVKYDISTIQKVYSKNIKSETIFSKVNPDLFNLNLLHPENDFIDFNFQRTLPHKFSQSNTPVVNADFNNDGLEDLYVGGSSRYPSKMFFQNKAGKFQDQNFVFKTDPNLKEEDSDALALDFDKDNDMDLIITRGTYQFKSGSELFKHLIFVNDGAGNFTKTYTIPIPNISVKCLKTADFDKDGDLDIFLGGGVKPQQFPLHEKTYLLINDTIEPNRPVFKIAPPSFDVSKYINYAVTDAIFTDFDQDSKLDLIVCGEWQNITFLKNTGSGYIDYAENTNIENYKGWWTKIEAADLDNDGDQDLIAGNYGLNIAFKATSDFPLNLWFKDFDNNGIIDPFISVFGKNGNNKPEEFFYHNRDDMNRQLPLLQKKFTTYLSFGQASATNFFDKEEMKSIQKRDANFLETCIFENLGNGKFRLIQLPIQCQFSPVNDFLVDDFNKDGFKDIIFVGNDYGMELVQGRADAGNGGLLINSGKGLNFNYLNYNLSGFMAPSESRKINYITVGINKYLMVNEVNKPLRIFGIRAFK